MTRSRLKQAYYWIVLPLMSLFFSVRVWEDSPARSAWHYVIVIFWVIFVGSMIGFVATRTRRTN